VPASPQREHCGGAGVIPGDGALTSLTLHFAGLRGVNTEAKSSPPLKRLGRYLNDGFVTSSC
jgi:hypothetical protein